ncbi:class I SAM-dependent methyltransferase [Methylotuvimicrobium sp.]|uniref:class I SAM-dependent methyltransferase n=1 Tax=Methylotuvimicrobium sp. TaxID=2822413 RepID=UPI003D656D1E
MPNYFDSKIYKRKPIEILHEIPVFSSTDDYIENYKKIASDHVNAMEPGKDNPFIANELWETLEQSTRVLLEKHISKGAKILDVGVGLGRLLAPLNQFDRYGLDISLDYLQVAKQQGIEVVFSKIEDMPYQDNIFDAVVVCDVLEHVLDLNQCCKKIIQVLKPDGFLFVRVPLKEDLNPYLNDNLPYQYIHLRSFDVASLRLHFEKIFKMGFVEASSAAPYLQGSARLKVRFLPEQQIIALREALTHLDQPAPLLDKIAQLSEEEFINWIYEWRDMNYSDYQKIADYIIYGMDVNAIFKKKKILV